jgi:hypothetical protein
MGLIDDSGRPIRDPGRGLKTPQQGASTIMFAATSPLLADIGGVYLKDNDISLLDYSAASFAFGSEREPLLGRRYRTPSTRSRHGGSGN